MKTLIIFDSLYGNTKEVAMSISEEISNSKVLSVEECKIEDLKGIDLLIVGSPTHGGSAKPTLLQFLNSIPSKSLEGIKVATFDTRFSKEEVNIFLKTLMSIIGYAAPKIEKILISKGGISIHTPLGIIVEGKEGPLKEGEILLAKKWVKEIL